MEEKRSGEFVGAFASYGYIKSPIDKHKLIIDKESAEIVRKIFEWKVNEGLGNLSICHRLNNMGVLNPTGYKKKRLNQNYNNSKMLREDYFWSPSTVRNILKNDIYIGNITQGKRKVKSYKIHIVEQVPIDEWITVKNMHEPIVDRELFEKAQNLGKIDTRVENTGKLSIWAGLLKCADCGHAMHKKYCKNKSGKIYEYYICGTYRKKSNQLCTKHTLKVEELENAVLEAIRLHIEYLLNIEELLKQFENIETCRGEHCLSGASSLKIEDIRNKKEKEIEKISNLKRYLYEDWKNEYINKEEYIEYKEKYEQDICRIKKIIENLQSEKETQRNIINKNSKWVEDFKLHRNITKLDRDIITELIDYIEVHENKKITIHFKFINEQDKIGVATKHTKEEVLQHQ